MVISLEYGRLRHSNSGYNSFHDIGSSRRQRSRALISSSALEEAADERPDGVNRSRMDSRSSEMVYNSSESRPARREVKSRHHRPPPPPTVSRNYEPSRVHGNSSHGCLANHLERPHIADGQLPISEQIQRLSSESSTDISSHRNNVQQRMLGTYLEQGIKNNSLHEVAMHARERLHERFRAASLLNNRMRRTTSTALRGVNHALSEEYVSLSGTDWETDVRNGPASRTGESQEFLQRELSSRSGLRPLALTRPAISSLQREVYVPMSAKNKESGDANFALEQEECPICLELFFAGEQMIKLTCFHRFHIACLTPWLTIHRECPCCRLDILQNQ
uniref:RING-type domain-containing protein n=1 Tax=Araucaria cunninghamii TaxID=56994 RepID=A0A0D6R7V5_ARACU